MSEFSAADIAALFEDDASQPTDAGVVGRVGEDDYGDIFDEEEDEPSADGEDNAESEEAGADADDSLDLDLDDEPEGDAAATDASREDDATPRNLCGDGSRWRIEADSLREGVRLYVQRIPYPPAVEIQTPDKRWLLCGHGANVSNGSRSRIDARLDVGRLSDVEGDLPTIRHRKDGLDLRLLAFGYDRLVGQVVRWWVNRNGREDVRRARYVAVSSKGLRPITFQQYCRYAERRKELQRQRRR